MTEYYKDDKLTIYDMVTLMENPINVNIYKKYQDYKYEKLDIDDLKLSLLKYDKLDAYSYHTDTHECCDDLLKDLKIMLSEIIKEFCNTNNYNDKLHVSMLLQEYHSFIETLNQDEHQTNFI